MTIKSSPAVLDAAFPNRRNLYAQQVVAAPMLTAAGVVRGVALPFNLSNERPGVSFEEDGSIRFFEFSVYAPDGMDWQLALPDYGGRVVFMWQHGGVDPFTGQTAFTADIEVLPIGNITRLYKQASPEGLQALWFDASFNDTQHAQEVRKAAASGSVKEVSTAIENLAWELDTDEQGRTFRRVTQFRLWDVSIVTRAQFTGTRIVEQLCQDCKARLASGHRDGDDTSEEHTAREVETLRQSVGQAQARTVQLETALRVAGVPVPPEPANQHEGC